MSWQQFTKNFAPSKYWNRKKMFKTFRASLKMNIFKSIWFDGWMWKTKIISPQLCCTVTGRNSWRDFEYFCEGQNLCELFRKEGFLSREKPFHATPQKNNFMPFSKVSVKCTIKSKDEKRKPQKWIEVH